MLISCFSYNPHKNNLCNHLDVITKILDTYYGKYESVVFLGDFNAGTEEITIKSFRESYNLTSLILIKQSTCFKNPGKPSYVDLILTNKPKSFQSTCVIETGSSDFHRMIASVTSYRDFSNYDNANFINSLNEVLCENENTESFLKDPEYFYKVLTEVRTKEKKKKSVRGKKYVRGNNKPFMNKGDFQSYNAKNKVKK